jgi:hypothetical protein
MNQNRQLRLVDFLPYRRKLRIGEIFARNVCNNHHADGAILQATCELGLRIFRILPGQRREPANPIRPRTLLFRHGVVYELGGLQTDFTSAPVDVGAGQRHDRHIDAGGVHVLDPAVVVPHGLEQREKRRPAVEDGVLPGLGLLHFQLRAAARAQ